MSSDEGDVVLDPFSGTGTTALAAKRLNRQYIGIELSEEYVEASQNKLAKENCLSKVNNLFVSCYLNDICTLRDKEWNQLEGIYQIPEMKKELDNTRIKLKPDYLQLVKTICGREESR
jgi:site-specific DNA-methyltransferase (adenine-specific)